MADYGVRLERMGHIAVVTLDRPDRQNALNDHMWDCIEGVVNDLKKELPRVLIITGAGQKAFCAGWDMNPASINTVGIAASRSTANRARRTPRSSRPTPRVRARWI